MYRRAFPSQLGALPPTGCRRHPVIYLRYFNQRARRVGHSSSRPQPQRTAKVRLRKKAAIVYLVKCLSSKEEKSVQFRLAAHKYAFFTICWELFNYFISLKNNRVPWELGRYVRRTAPLGHRYSINAYCIKKCLPQLEQQQLKLLLHNNLTDFSSEETSQNDFFYFHLWLYLCTAYDSPQALF